MESHNEAIASSCPLWGGIGRPPSTARSNPSKQKKNPSPIGFQKEVFILLAGNEIFIWSGADSVPVQRAVACMKAVELAKFEMTAHIHHISGSDDGQLPTKLAEVLLCGQSSPNKSESFYSFSSVLSTTGQSLWLMPRRETVSDTGKRCKVWKIGRGPNGGMSRELGSVLSVSDPRCSYLIDRMVIPGEFKQECSWGVGLLHGNLTSSLVRTYARMCYDELVRSRGGSLVCLTHEGTIGVESATSIQEWFEDALVA